MSSIFETLPTIRLFTVDEYYQMSNLGILSPEEKTELIDGEIIAMVAQNPPHVSCTQLGYDYLTNVLKDIAFVRIQAPIWLSNRSLPELDLAIVRLPKAQYYERHPRPEDIYWLIKVSDATLKYDLNTKAKLYARANIKEYWVIDAVERHIYVHQNPHKGVYQDKNRLLESDIWRNLTFSDISIDLARFFPPNS
ncbi:MAG: Uma2 family endonuclease [Chroococcidiopsidaceae cyanobacterium CP_BM_RX_35]|nr:Uma2 family endonuclease [Chroococcidiopsidaceae cyanobacterium CP_BM_RX_35]